MQNGKTKYTDAQVQKIVGEVFDDKKVVLLCGRHNYSPGGPKLPVKGCRHCWFAYYVHLFAKIPPHLRREKMEELQSIMRVMAEMEDKGKYDFEPFAHPVIEVNKEDN